jgi:hypothetical protein
VVTHPTKGSTEKIKFKGRPTDLHKDSYNKTRKSNLFLNHNFDEVHSSSVPASPPQGTNHLRAKKALKCLDGVDERSSAVALCMEEDKPLSYG